MLLFTRRVHCTFYGFYFYVCLWDFQTVDVIRDHVNEINIYIECLTYL